MKKAQFNFFIEKDIFIPKKISIIIPTKNEEGNIQSLIERIDKAVTSKSIQYEIIFIDDHSVDNTRKIINKFSATYPVSLYLKKGENGKAQSIIEGFSYAKYAVICMIDADLQYPPEVIPYMFEKIRRGKDVIVGNRDEKNITLKRRVTSKAFFYLFGKFLHGFNCDVQSGLKIFKKEIVERFSIAPSPWTFDLEFLLKARNAGYSIDTFPITFFPRFSGNSKVNIVKTAVEIGIMAIKQKFVRPTIIPFHPVTIQKKGNGFHFKGDEFITHTDLSQDETAFFRLSPNQTTIILCFIAAGFVGLLINWHTTVTFVFAIITLIYFSDLLFNLFLIKRSFSDNAEIYISEEDVKHEKMRMWPRYTILCPLYKEANVLPQFVNAIETIDYPKNKLQVIILLEEDDKETIKKIKTMKLPYFFEIVVAPPSQPKTKPKALNYGLKFTKGEYTVVYDAEDIPDPLQLKKVILAFEKKNKKTVCIQAKLNFYNPHQNALTKIFTAEYSLWFDLILTGLQSIEAPIPLGGTSNHFKTKYIRQLKGWDAFNVTEDCDLGIRLAKHGYHTAIVNSTTLEEANSEIINWFRQRGRWIKGYIQTYLVHNRHPKKFFQFSKKTHLATFQLIVGGKILSLFINPFMWITTLIYFTFRAKYGSLIESFFPPVILYMGTISLVFGNFLYMYYYMIGAARREHYAIIKYAFIVPLYWIGMSITAWQALYKIIVQPHYWAKTKHGLHLTKTKQNVPSAAPSFKNTLDKPSMPIFPKLNLGV